MGKEGKEKILLKKWQQCSLLLIYGWVLITKLAQPLE